MSNSGGLSSSWHRSIEQVDRFCRQLMWQCVEGGGGMSQCLLRRNVRRVKLLSGGLPHASTSVGAEKERKKIPSIHPSVRQLKNFYVFPCYRYHKEIKKKKKKNNSWRNFFPPFFFLFFLTTDEMLSLPYGGASFIIFGRYVTAQH